MAEHLTLIAHGAKLRQNFEEDPPRCMSCVFFRREPHTLFELRQVKNRRGKLRTIKVSKRKDAVLNPIVDRCSFGNFLTKPHAVCDEWRNRTGEVIASE